MNSRPDANKRIRVLVVDDSVVIRKLVTSVLEAHPEVEVCGTAENGKIAVEQYQKLKPDAMTMDIEMPLMNGIEAVRAIRRIDRKVPIVMFSTLTERGASATLDALQAGASEYVTKPSNVGSFDESRDMVREQLIPKLLALGGRAGSGRAEQARAARVASSAPVPPVRAPRRDPSQGYGVLAIGCSTGGPDALAAVLPKLAGDLPVPVVIVQHMPPLFTKMLAQRLDSASKLTVVEATAGEVLKPGKVYIAPGGEHMELKASGFGPAVKLTQDPPENFCRPAVDVLFRSVAAIYGERTLAVVLTGMGHDGEAGARALRQAGATVWAQDEASSVVWGMPGAVTGAGLAEKVLPLDTIHAEISGALLRRPAATGARP